MIAKAAFCRKARLSRRVTRTVLADPSYSADVLTLGSAYDAGGRDRFYGPA